VSGTLKIELITPAFHTLVHPGSPTQKEKERKKTKYCGDLPVLRKRDIGHPGHRFWFPVTWFEATEPSSKSNASLNLEGP